jgi:hypothetical protein
LIRWRRLRMNCCAEPAPSVRSVGLKGKRKANDKVVCSSRTNVGAEKGVGCSKARRSLKSSNYRLPRSEGELSDDFKSFQQKVFPRRSVSLLLMVNIKRSNYSFMPQLRFSGEEEE